MEKNTNLSMSDSSFLRDETDRPLISVIMSVYNCESTVEAAIRSIYEQTYSNWELIICDDASTDETLSVVRSVLSEREESKYKIITNDENLKLAASLNRCLELVSGEFVARMDGDDLSAPERFEKQIEFLTENPDVDLVGTAMRRFNARGFGGYVFPAELEPDKWTMSKKSRSPFAHATIMTKKSIYTSLDYYTVHWTTERAEDVDLWYKFFAKGFTGRNLQDALYYVREDDAAIRRRTPKSRLAAFIVRVKGNRSLNYPLSAYVLAFYGLAKALIPYQVFNLHRRSVELRSKKK